MEGDISFAFFIPVLIISIHSLRVEGDRVTGTSNTTPLWISIHSLRVEGDLAFADGLYCHTQYFNPLPPCGGRQFHAIKPSAYFRISIHSLRVEGDSYPSTNRAGFPIFQSTPSVWRETFCLRMLVIPHSVFQSTPSVWRETGQYSARNIHRVLFQSTPSVWRETTIVHAA